MNELDMDRLIEAAEQKRDELHGLAKFGGMASLDQVANLSDLVVLLAMELKRLKAKLPIARR